MIQEDRPNLSKTKQLALLGVSYFAVATIAIALSRNSGNIATFWFANAIGIAFLLSKENQDFFKTLSVLGLANLFANFISGNSLSLSAVFVLPNLLEMAIAAWGLKKIRLVQDFDQHPTSFLKFIFAGSFAPPLISATIGALLMNWLDYEAISSVWPIWYSGSTIGSVALLPLLMLFFNQGGKAFFQKIEGPLFVSFALATVSTCIFALVYLPFPFIYLTLPLVFAAISLSFESVSLLVLLLTIAAGATFNTGYFVMPPVTSNWQLILTYMPLLLAIIPAMVLSASMNQVKSREKARQQIEEALKQKHIDLKTIINNVPAMIGYWTVDLKNQFANDAYLRYFGYSPEQAFGRALPDLIGSERYREIEPFVLAALRGEAQIYERNMFDQDGMHQDTLVSVVPHLVAGKVDGFYAFLTDITPVKNAQRAQFEAQSQLQAIIDSASEFAIIATRLDGIITMFSKGAEKMLGYLASELVMQQTPALLHLEQEILARGHQLSAESGQSVNGFEVFIMRARQGNAEQGEWTYLRKDGSTFPVRLVVTAICDEHGKITGFLGIAEDITKQKELQSLMIAAKENAEATSRAKSDFVANMSHEIRTPMNAVLGITQLLANTKMTLDQRKYLEMIRVSGQALMRILNDILDFSKIEAGRLELSPREFFLDDILSALASMMAVNAQDKNLELAFGVEPGVPKKLFGDELRLQQILTNITGNSIKFTSTGEVSVFVDLVPESLDTVSGQLLLRISVRDTGIGMSEEQIAKIFSAFSQADASITRKFGGTGLGLAISRRLVELMDGTIHVESQLGFGTQFQVTIPMKMVNEEIIVTPGREMKEMHLLVVDDSQTSRDYICKTIRSWNWNAESAGSGIQAIEIVKASKLSSKPFDAILVDWQMPMMDGFITLKSLREILNKNETPLIVMVNAFDRDKTMQKQASLYADAILMKPITGSSLFDTLHEAIVFRSDEQNNSPFNDVFLDESLRLGGARILLVEDNPLNQIVAQGLLEQVGAQVEIAENGALALDLLRLNPKLFDLILMDVQMPVMDGITATRLIREELKLDIPILAMTAGVMNSERDRCIHAGMIDFIAKPIDLNQMISTIKNYLPVAFAETLPGAAVEKDIAIFANESNELEGYFEPAGMLALAKNQPQLTQRILLTIRKMIEGIAPKVDELKLSWAEGRATDTARICHSLRGSLGTLGASRFSAISIEIENAINAGETDRVPDLIEIAGQQLVRTQKVALDWLDRQEILI